MWPGANCWDILILPFELSTFHLWGAGHWRANAKTEVMPQVEATTAVAAIVRRYGKKGDEEGYLHSDESQDVENISTV
ncbi:hypothetical protein PG994_014781 [Apiospora phragmitis]|uniref:Uncharacterized protein n=1 Tax=Apiospora phragmitis TaxID=2905665 RepID=A0ABR1SW96_9PEZI